ncbi:MAG: hypothetical protein AAF696_10385, partial [Bacteroidota bacterium]
FLYHCGTDNLFRTLEFKATADAFQVKNGETFTFGFDLDPAKMFVNDNKAVDIINDNITHTGDFFSIAEAVTENFINNALTKQ